MLSSVWFEWEGAPLENHLAKISASARLEWIIRKDAAVFSELCSMREQKSIKPLVLEVQDRLLNSKRV
jgi:hypothetical protein